MLTLASHTFSAAAAAAAGEVETSYSHTSAWVSSAGCNVQTIGRDVLYTPRLETRLKTGRRNKVAVGALFSRLGEDYSHPFGVSVMAVVVLLLLVGVPCKACRHRVSVRSTSPTPCPD